MNMNQNQQQVIALAGLFQEMEAVDHIAQTGRCNEVVLETSLKSLFVENPENVEEEPEIPDDGKKT